MKPFFFFLLLPFLVSCQADSKYLLGLKPVNDLSETPIYPRLTEEKDGQIVWKENFRYIDDIEINLMAYLSDGLKVRGYMVRPKAPGTYPCIIYNRGGNQDFGSLKIAHAAMRMGQLAKEGYVVIASQYRGNGGSEGKEEFGGKDINDVLNLIHVLAEIPSADTSRIGMYGGSRGGMMTYIALTKTNQLKAAAVLGAPSDKFAGLEDRPGFEKLFEELIPDFKANREAELTKRSAIKWADQFPKDVPVLVMHGTSDWRVKPSQSLRLALEFDKYRIPYRLMMFEGGDHGLSEHRAEFNQNLIGWFDRYLKKGEALPDMSFHGN